MYPVRGEAEGFRVLRDSLPAASEVFAALPPPRQDGEALRAEVRALREADGLLLGVLDDDPTGSQSVHGVQVVTVPEEDACQAAFAAGADTCLVLTNTRSPRRAGRHPGQPRGKPEAAA